MGAGATIFVFDFFWAKEKKQNAVSSGNSKAIFFIGWGSKLVLFYFVIDFISNAYTLFGLNFKGKPVLTWTSVWVLW